MSRKPETVYTAKMLNAARREEKSAARNARRRIADFDSFVGGNANRDICYININGFAMPVRRSF